MIQKKKITDIGVNNSSVKLIKKGSILFSFKLSLGKMGIAGCDMYCNEAIAFMNFKSDIHKYMYYNMYTRNYKKYASGSIGIGNMNLKILKGLNFKLPKNKSLIKALEPTFKKIEQLQQKKLLSKQQYENTLKELKDDINKPPSKNNSTRDTKPSLSNDKKNIITNKKNLSKELDDSSDSEPEEKPKTIQNKKSHIKTKK